MIWQQSRGTGQGKGVNKTERKIKTVILAKKKKKRPLKKKLL